MDFFTGNTDMTFVHEELYKILYERRKKDSTLRYSFRKSNHANRMEEGYWFYGNDSYLAISFWTGMDWKNRTPNIVFIITSSGECYLEINVSDSDNKRAFVREHMINILDLSENGRKYIKHYENIEKGPFEIFIDFLEGDKIIIDDIIRFRTNNPEPEVESIINLENRIELISRDEFQKRHTKIKKYRQLRQELEIEDSVLYFDEKPFKILAIDLEDYGRISKIEFEIEDPKNQWIFITGENGSGKTNLLRGIATVLGNRYMSEKELADNQHFKCHIKLLKGSEIEEFTRISNSGAKGKRRPIVQGLAMYGPYRLDKSNDKISKSKLNRAYLKEGSFESLYSTGAPLLNLDRQFAFWQNGVKKERDLFEKRKYFITSVLTDIVPDLYDIWFKEKGNTTATEYVFRDTENSPSRCLSWQELPSGIKSTISMMGDILLRLYDQQRNIIDPSEFKGIVIIDEIDLHLHPQAQRDLVENLTKVLPDIQFIVSTHSPIPLLGANKHSAFFRMDRDFTTVKLTRLKHIENYIQDLLPQHLLTSDLFKLNNITSVQKKNQSTVYTGSTITSYIEYKNLEEDNIIVFPDIEEFRSRIRNKINEKDS